MTAAVPASVGARLKWRLFRALERLSDLRGNNAAGHFAVTPPASDPRDPRGAARPAPALWVFVSTIGELHAIDPFLRQLATQLGALQLVLITDHPHYRESYQARYPAAAVCVTRGHGHDAVALARRYPPQALVVAEIPCLPFDAPCRFSYGFVLEAKRRRAPAWLVNGWLYHYRPDCTMDRVERALFLRDYLRAFDVLCVQTEAARRELVALGAPAQRVAVAGNIKFDSMQRSAWHVAEARSPRLLAALLAARRPTVVAGCVTSAHEQHLVLDAFAALRRRHPTALLVLAPRHPEVTGRMQALRELLAEAQLHARFRSTSPDAALADDVACLVLDTMGDLRDFYAAATLAHVGVDHNVLEPLGFAKPVTVTTGWEPTYPSYPVYRLLADAGALFEATDPARLAAHWAEAVERQGADAECADADRTDGQGATPALAALEAARGSVGRHFAAIQGGLTALIGQLRAPDAPGRERPPAAAAEAGSR